MANGELGSLCPTTPRLERSEYVGKRVAAGASLSEAENSWDRLRASDFYENEEYFVQLDKSPSSQLGGAFKVFALVISRVDGRPVTDWRDLQEIKNRVVGRDCDAVELYPARSRSFDFDNRTVLFCYVGSEEFNPPTLPFGSMRRVVSSQSFVPHCTQRSGHIVMPSLED